MKGGSLATPKAQAGVSRQMWISEMGAEDKRGWGSDRVQRSCLAPPPPQCEGKMKGGWAGKEG